MRVVVVGGGIGGLTAAIALQRAGIEADVYERAAALGEVGAGIGLMANGVRALELLGLGTAVRSHGLSGAQGGLRTWEGKTLIAVPTDEFSQRFGGMAVMHRADLLAALARELDPARLHPDRECVGFEEDAHGITAAFRRGEAARGDVLIGADGLRSAIRTQLFGNHRPRYAGYTAWRAVVPFEHAGLSWGESWGRGRRFGIVPMTESRVYWFATSNAREGENDPKGGRKANLLRLFRGWHEPIEAVIEASQESSILRNDIYDLNPLAGWSRGRVTLLGDAAHPMTPNLAQGACQAIEDAVVLAVCLKRPADAAFGLASYEQRRIPRVRGIVLQSRRFGAAGQWESGLLRGLRDAFLKAMAPKLTARSMEALAGQEVLTADERALLSGQSSR